MIPNQGKYKGNHMEAQHSKLLKKQSQREIRKHSWRIKHNALKQAIRVTADLKAETMKL